MAFITDILNTIKNAHKGKDMRQAIYDGIQQCYEDATGHPDSVAAAVKKIGEVSANLSKETADRKAEVNTERKRIDNLIKELPATAGEYQQSKLVLHSYDNAAVKCTTTSGNYTNVPAFTTDQGGPLSSLYTKKSNYQIAVNKSGLYLFELRIHVNSLIANKRVELAPFVNDTRIAALASSYNTAGNFTLTQVAALPLWLSANDTVDFRIAPIEAVEVSLQLGDVLVYAIDWEDKFKIPDYTGYAAETKDIRTGADGTVYGTAGEAVRKQIGNITEDLANQENRLEPIVKSNEDSKDAFYICDADGNIICKVDKDGVHSTGFDGKNLALNDVISTYEDSFYISDSNGNVIFKVDKDGVQGLNMGVSSGVDSPFKGMKLLTIGDSLSAHNNWQKWLVEWLGVTFDNDENINGKDGHKPMAKGGTAIAPTAEDSIYMRSLDAKYYADDTNGTVIIIYAGQNDSVALGTIDDTPYTDKTVTASSNLTFYSSYMGMIENILADIPFARIYLMTQMPVRLEIGMTGTADPYIGVIRFPDITSVLAYEASRYKKVEAIRAISKKYSLPCIDLWEDSGINDYNSKYWYGAVGGTCGQVHPNNIGYKRMAEVAVAKMY